jgi:probable HAF family extracellular repeat protein
MNSNRSLVRSVSSPTACVAAMCSLFASAAGAEGALVNLGAHNAWYSSYASGSYASGVNADGSVIVGGAYRRVPRFQPPEGAAFRWTQASGMASLGTLNGGSFSVANGVNADGSVVVGSAIDGAVPQLPFPYAPRTRAFRWTQASGMVSLGTLNGGSSSSASGVNANGLVVVGSADDAALQSRAFRWTPATGMVNLGTLNGGRYCYASAVNADGSVIVGSAADGAAQNQSRAFRWTQASGMANLGTLNGGSYSFASAVNATGSVVVGYGDDGAAQNQDRAFRWTQASGMVSLGTLNGGSSSSASGVNATGSVVVGSALDGAAQNQPRAFRWTQASGMISVEDWLRTNGVAVGKGLTLTDARAVNADASVVVGSMNTGGFTSTAYLARVSPLGNGLMDVDPYYQTLSGPNPPRTALRA